VDQPGFLRTLRLASKHLEEPLLLPFWHALLGEPLVLLPEETAAFETPIHGASRKLGPLSATDVDNTKRALLATSPHIQFLFSQVVKEQGGLANSFAPTVRAHPNDAVFRHLNVNAPGSGSVISPKFKFSALLSDHSVLTLEAKLRLSLLLARILLHEVAHAIYNYRVSRTIEILGRDGTLEPFFKDQTYARSAGQWNTVSSEAIQLLPTTG
jgi:hypothetical protein